MSITLPVIHSEQLNQNFLLFSVDHCFPMKPSFTTAVEEKNMIHTQNYFISVVSDD